jgi:hypothetical protein
MISTNGMMRIYGAFEMAQRSAGAAKAAKGVEQGAARAA